MSTKTSLVDEIISRWDSLAAFARYIDVPAVTVRQWRKRGHIPLGHWRRVQTHYFGHTGITVDLERFLDEMPNG
jgi:hypothetical protein